MPKHNFDILPESISAFVKVNAIVDGLEIQMLLNQTDIAKVIPQFDDHLEPDGWAIQTFGKELIKVTEEEVARIFNVDLSPVTKNIREAKRLMEKYYEEIEWQINDIPRPAGDEELAAWQEDRRQVELWLDDVAKVWKGV